MKNICIIGGGACGTAVFIELVLQILTEGLQDKVSLTLVERDQKMGHGLAFGTKQKSHLLNTPANLMGIFANEPEHFADWLKRNNLNEEKITSNQAVNEAYTSRILYGDYVAEQLKTFIEKAKKLNIKVEVIQQEAINLNKENENFKIHFKDGKITTSQMLILAPGTPKPNNFDDCASYPEFIDFPWPVEKIKQNVEKNESVGVLGTSLSAIDTILTLADQDHQGKIRLFSPEGFLPRVQPDEFLNVERKWLTPSYLHRLKRKDEKLPTVKTLMRLFLKDFNQYKDQVENSKLKKREVRNAHQLLTEDLKLAEDKGDLVLNLMYSLRYDASKIWSWLSVEQKKQFEKSIGTFYKVNRHAIPKHNAKRLLKLFKKGQLEVYGNFQDFEKTEKGFQLKTKTKKFQVDKLINATGTATHVKDMKNELLQNLLKENWIKPYPLGGIEVNELTMLVDCPKGNLPFYALGHINNGRLLDVNSVWFNVRTAQRAAKDILFKIQQDGSIS